MIEDSKIILYIDTSDNKKVTLKLTIRDQVYAETTETKTLRGSQVVLPLIDELLKRHQVSLSDLTAIEVHPGPGSYTGLRVGAAVGNALAYSLQIPINNLPVGTFFYPVYE